MMMVMTMMMFLDDTCSLLLPYAKLGFTICQFWSCISLFPGIQWGFLSLYQPQLQCCLWVCVNASVSGLLFLSITFLVLVLYFFPFPKKLVVHWFYYCHLPNTSYIMIKPVDITLKERSQNQKEETEGSAQAMNQNPRLLSTKLKVKIVANWLFVSIYL